MARRISQRSCCCRRFRHSVLFLLPLAVGIGSMGDLWRKSRAGYRLQTAEGRYSRGETWFGLCGQCDRSEAAASSPRARTGSRSGCWSAIRGRAGGARRRFRMGAQVRDPCMQPGNGMEAQGRCRAVPPATNRRQSRRRPLTAQGADQRLVPDAAIRNTPL
jgi:hypothetical protein